MSGPPQREHPPQRGLLQFPYYKLFLRKYAFFVCKNTTLFWIRNIFSSFWTIIWPIHRVSILKIWPNYGQDWNIKEKRFCIFAHLELLAKSLWCPEQDLNLHIFRYTHLKRARLPIPPSGPVELLSLGAIFSGCSVCRQLFPFWCPGQDLNLHALIGTTPSK